MSVALGLHSCCRSVPSRGLKGGCEGRDGGPCDVVLVELVEEGVCGSVMRLLRLIG